MLRSKPSNFSDCVLDHLCLEFVPFRFRRSYPFFDLLQCYSGVESLVTAALNIFLRRNQASPIIIPVMDLPLLTSLAISFRLIWLEFSTNLVFNQDGCAFAISFRPPVHDNEVGFTELICHRTLNGFYIERAVPMFPGSGAFLHLGDAGADELIKKERIDTELLFEKEIDMNFPYAWSSAIVTG